MSSGMWDGGDDFGDLGPRSILERLQFTLHSVAFFPFTNDFMINSALQGSNCWKVPEATRPWQSLIIYAVLSKPAVG
jgi:hypothetical protein